MNLDIQPSPLTDPMALVAQADSIRGMGQEASGSSTVVEDALRQAHRRLAVDLDTIAANNAAKQPTDYTALFGALFPEKVAAALLLAKYTVLDLAHASRDVADIDAAHRTLAMLAEMLFRTEAADALICLFMFAQEQVALPCLNPRVWQNVASHCLMLLALLESQRPRVVAFFAQSPAAREQLQQAISFTRPEVIGQLLKESHEASPGEETAPPPYMKIFDRLEPGMPPASALGIAALIYAQAGIALAMQTTDLPGLACWFQAGSPLAAYDVLRQTKTRFTARDYRHFLGFLLEQEALAPERLAAVVMELGALNRTERAEGGVGEINHMLFEMAMQANKERIGVSRLAVRELRQVNNQDALLVIAEQAPLLGVAEEAVTAMKELRRLLRVKPLVTVRPELYPAYKMAERELQEIERMMEAVWVCDNPAMVEMYVKRLTELQAFGELEKIAKLAQKKDALTR
ncbi:MAG TPA: hypothetical protein VGL77_11770 [Armatimonadota bacterium]|jgi:hypothetical protein